MINLKIAAYRKQHNLTQVELATRLGVSFQTVSKWENSNYYPDIEMLSGIADLFGITIDELVGRDSSKHSIPYKDRGQYWSKEIDYLQETRKELWNDDYLEFLVKAVWKISEPVDIIDYGCGFGYLGVKLMPLMPQGSTYTGIEIDNELIDHAEKIFAESRFDTKFIHSDLYEFDPSKKYDITISQALMRHLRNPRGVMQKMYDSTKIGGKVICVDVNRVFEEVGYFNDHFTYDPFKSLKIFEGMWKNEEANGGRDYGMGIKIPSMMKSLGLTDIESRMNDKVAVATKSSDIKNITEAKGWIKSYIKADYESIRTRSLKEGAELKEVDTYIEWLKENLEDVQSDKFDGSITFCRGMMVTWGSKG